MTFTPIFGNSESFSLGYDKYSANISVNLNSYITILIDIFEHVTDIFLVFSPILGDIQIQIQGEKKHSCGKTTERKGKIPNDNPSSKLEKKHCKMHRNLTCSSNSQLVLNFRKNHKHTYHPCFSFRSSAILICGKPLYTPSQTPVPRS